ncbi:hypothetical protein E1A91_A09G141200v1 [Gossypium mustelinum]|uniref:Protein-lysine N-methyltransferase n=1 Tax=Gossypium mustelinum TaxID=34275 RepID=A0A5D2Y0L4_GOSMU|nr:hypothetical protein E1A91_A09G141200v1 [Gossypium mustelinum]
MEPQLPTIKNVFVNETDDDDRPALSSHALAALKEFLEEQRQSPANHETAENGEGTLEPESEVDLVTEDWRLSQFWYDPETARTLSQEVLSLCSHSNCKVACIACPTLYAYLKKIDPNISVQLLEYDKRFEQYGSDFTFYDYNQPKDLPLELKHTYQVVIADPPYLSYFKYIIVGECEDFDIFQSQDEQGVFRESYSNNIFSCSTTRISLAFAYGRDAEG